VPVCQQLCLVDEARWTRLFVDAVIGDNKAALTELVAARRGLNENCHFARTAVQLAELSIRP
jgi:hypothetical protein